jgi:broad specificity phosphatase PhoE
VTSPGAGPDATSATEEAPPGAPGSIEPAPGEPKPSLIPDELDATIVLVRHGESEWVARGLFQGQGDSPLTELGRRQAALVADRLATPHRPPAIPVPGDPPLEIVHSPLSRTTETAEVMATAMARPAAFGAEIARRSNPGFLEIGQGEWEGVAGAEIVERWGDVLDGWRQDPLTAWAPGGETLPQVDARVRVALAEVLARLLDARPAGAIERSPVLGYVDEPSNEPWSVIVGHDGTFKVVTLALLDLPLSRFWTFPFALCGISVIELRGGRPRLRLHNATDHLAPLETEAARLRDAERGRTGAL